MSRFELWTLNTTTALAWAVALFGVGMMVVSALT